MRRSGPPKRKTELKRTGGLAPRSKVKRAYKPPHADEKALSTRFHVKVTQGARCLLCRAQEPRVRLEAHHVLPKSFLRREGFDYRVVYDPDVGVALCSRCHANVTTRTVLVPLDKLPAAVVRFARRHGLEWRLEQETTRR